MEITADRSGSMACAFAARLRLSNLEFAADPENQPDGSLPSGIRNRRLRPRLEGPLLFCFGSKDYMLRV